MNLTDLEYASSSIESGFTRDSIYLLVYFSTAIVALIGNSIVVKVVFTIPKMRTFIHVLLANMAFSDILCATSFITGLGLCCDKFLIQYGNIYCVANKALQLLSFQVSSVTMTVVAIDRWIAVFYPFYSHDSDERPLSIIKLVLGIWCISTIIIVGTSPSLGFQRYFTPHGPLIKCELAKAFDLVDLSPRVQRIRLVIANLAHFWFPLILITAAYGSIAYRVWQRKLGADVTQQQMDILMLHKWKTIKMLIAAVAIFLSCWLPFFIFNIIIFSTDSSKKRPCSQSITYLALIWLAFSSCCYNPFIYWIYNETYRKGIKSFINFVTCQRNLKSLRPRPSQEAFYRSNSVNS